MGDDVIFLKKGKENKSIQKPGKLYRYMGKTKNMQAIIAELDPNSESIWHRHDGEELHLVLEGEMEYTVGEKTYKMREGDLLWHSSTKRHRAKNTHKDKVVYITVGSPPTFK